MPPRRSNATAAPRRASCAGGRCGRGPTCSTRSAAALQFPPYFGENADALDECLTDLEWLEADAYVLTVLDAVRVLDREGAEARHGFWEQLRDAAAEWGRNGKAFRVVAQCTADEEAGLRAGWSRPGLSGATLRIDEQR